jgi:hypothetical protein
MAHETIRSTGHRARLADYFYRPISGLKHSLWALLHDADRDKDPVSLVGLTSSPTDDWLRADGAIAVLKGGDVVEMFRQWAVRNKILTPDKRIVDKGEPQLEVKAEPAGMPIPDGEAYVTIPTHESTAAVPSVPEAQRLQRLLKAAQDLGEAVQGLLVSHRGYVLRLSYAPAPDRGPWIASGETEDAGDGSPATLNQFGATPQQAIESCADELAEFEADMLAFEEDDDTDTEDEETTEEYTARIAREHEARGEPPIPPGTVDLAILSQALHHAQNPAAAIRGAFTILKPGGRIVVLDLLQHTL